MNKVIVLSLCAVFALAGVSRVSADCGCPCVRKEKPCAPACPRVSKCQKCGEREQDEAQLQEEMEAGANDDVAGADLESMALSRYQQEKAKFIAQTHPNAAPPSTKAAKSVAPKAASNMAPPSTRAAKPGAPKQAAPSVAPPSTTAAKPKPTGKPAPTARPRASMMHQRPVSKAAVTQ